jgi:hypothetical protein
MTAETAGPASRPGGAVAARWALLLLAVAVLFFCYWRQSWAAPVSSDGSSNALQAWAMLHGNLLLRHWWVSDVSFYTTELPQYMLIEALLGLGPGVIHVAAAMTYTLLVLLAALVARGDARGGKGLARALLAAGLMLSPQLSATPTVLLSPDHTGTAVPLLAVWLLIERARPRWYVPVLVGLVFAWTMVADSVILLTGIIPLMLVAAVRAYPGLIRWARTSADAGQPGLRWYELSLGGAAAAAAVAGEFASRLVTALGGYSESHVGADLDLAQLQHGSWVTFQAFLELFGANVFATSFLGSRAAAEAVLVAVHLVGAAAAVWSLGVAFRRFFGGDLLLPVFAVAAVVNLGAYMISTHAQNLLGAREMAAVLPLGVVVAGRVLGDRLPGAIRAARAWVVPLLAVLAAASLATLGYDAAQPAAAAANEPLAGWLEAHHLTDGLATYWQANSTTVDSGHRVLVNAVVQNAQDRLAPYQWETDDADYDPARHDATFVVADGPAALPGMQLSAELTFGRPQRTYRADGYLIMVWNTNLLTKLASPS